MGTHKPQDRVYLKSLHEMRATPGLVQVTCRLAVLVGMIASAVLAFQGGRYGLYAGIAVTSAVWFAGLLTLTHDALHHRLTGIRRLDDALARLIAWPIGWPIGVYALVHLAHHRTAGSSLEDAERIQPTQAEYRAATAVTRWYFRNQVWFNIFVAGGGGLLARLARAAWRHRAQLPGLRRDAMADAFGILSVTVLWMAAAYASGGWPLVGAGACLWVVTERAVGIVHATRNHAEHYGLWGARATRLETQYLNARDIETNALTAWYFNHLNRHATHHALMGVPYYNLERAHAYLRQALARESVPVVPAGGYLSEIIAANRRARRGGFIEQGQGTP